MSLKTDISKIIDDDILDFISRIENKYFIFIDARKMMSKIKNPKINKPIFDFIEYKRENYIVTKYDENHVVYKNFIINKKTETVVGKISDSSKKNKLEFEDIQLCNFLNLTI